MIKWVIIWLVSLEHGSVPNLDSIRVQSFLFFSQVSKDSLPQTHDEHPTLNAWVLARGMGTSPEEGRGEGTSPEPPSDSLTQWIGKLRTF